MEAGFSIGDSEAMRQVSGSERWNRTEFYYASFQLIPMTVMLLTRWIIHTKRVQSILARKESTTIEESYPDYITRLSSNKPAPTQLEQLRMSCVILCVLAILFMDLKKP